MAADIVAADSWSTKNGYPDFDEKNGRNFVIVRNQLGLDILKNCVKDGAIHIEDLNINAICVKQPYQYNRRRQIGWRIIGVQIASCGYFRFKNIGVLKNMRYINIIKGLSILYGSFKRYFTT